MPYGYDTEAIPRGRGGRSSAGSRQVFLEAVQPSLTGRQDAFLAALRSLPNRQGTAKQVADAMHVPLHTVSGRVSELVKLGLVRRTGRRVEDSEVLETVQVAAQESLF